VRGAEVARALASAALAAVDPERLVRESLAARGGRFTAAVALGKAAPAMARGAGSIGRRRLLVRPHSTPALFLPAWEQKSGGHPLPDRQSLAAGECLLRLLAALNPSDSLLVLLSGGSSACVEQPVAGIPFEDLLAVHRALLDSGLPIGTVNAVRRRLSAIKGGGALRATRASRITQLLLSDVPGDDPATLGSGPFVADAASAAEAAAVEAIQGLTVPPRVRAQLEEGMRGPRAAEAPDGRVETLLLAGPRTAALGAMAEARRRGFVSTTGDLSGEATLAGRELVAAGRRLQGSEVALIWSGETTVRLAGDRGQGGRNLELALAAARELAGSSGELVVTLATDGVDGNTRAAGGIVGGETWSALGAAGIDPAAALARHDSFRALSAVPGAVLTTGPTGTNVSDLAIYLRSDRLTGPIC
jgi:glycerate 2-kinase